MPLPSVLEGRLRLPVIASPMFIVSQLDLVLAQCRAGIVGSFPALNARPSGVLEQWLQQLTTELTDEDAPYAVNLIVHSSVPRLEEDLALCVKYRVPIVITSIGAREDIFAAIHSYGGIVLHDVTTVAFGRKAVEKGADGLVAVAAGAGGHGGSWSPFALVQEIRSWYDGPLALGGAISSGRSIAAARLLGADLAYIGSAFIATDEASAEAAYKKMVVECSASDILYTDYFSGVHANFLRPSVAAAGFDPHALHRQRSTIEFPTGSEQAAKMWRDIWSAGQGIGEVRAIRPVAAVVSQLAEDFEDAVSGFDPL